jgi:hypothetical protein
MYHKKSIVQTNKLKEEISRPAHTATTLVTQGWVEAKTNTQTLQRRRWSHKRCQQATHGASSPQDLPELVAALDGQAMEPPLSCHGTKQLGQLEDIFDEQSSCVYSVEQHFFGIEMDTRSKVLRTRSFCKALGTCFNWQMLLRRPLRYVRAFAVVHGDRVRGEHPHGAGHEQVNQVQRLPPRRRVPRRDHGGGNAIGEHQHPGLASVLRRECPCPPERGCAMDPWLGRGHGDGHG